MTVRAISLNHRTIEATARAEAADLSEMIKKINGDFKDVRFISIIYSNADASDLSKVCDTDFRVHAIIPGMNYMTGYVERLRSLYPAVTYRVMELHEGKFSSFYEYVALALEQEAA